MSEFVQTPLADQAYQMCEVVLSGEQYRRMGQITGEPGTGKSTVTKWLTKQFGGIRIECWAGMAEKHMLQELAKAYDAKFDTNISHRGTSNTYIQRFIEQGLDGTLIMVDEANHLKVGGLEKLRALSDQGHAGVVIAGTDILSRTLNHPQIRIYLDQLRQRIGAKKIHMQPIGDKDELATYVLEGRFKTLTASGAKLFFHHTQGNWRTALELADACERLMVNENLTKLDESIVATASAWMAGAQ